MANLTAAQKSLAQACGLDPTKFDPTKLWQLIQMIIALLSGLTPVQHKAALKAAGCPDDQADACCACMQAGALALQSAEVSFGCCAGKCPTP